MSDDLVKQLNEACIGHPHAKIPWPHRLLHDARDAIERLTRERDERNTRMWETAKELGDAVARADAAERKVEKLREALKPFAKAVDYYASAATDEYPIDRGEFALGDLRRAVAALAETEKGE